MGLRQSKDASLYQEVINGNIEGVQALHREGAGLEWCDKEGKTPLIVACLNPQLYHIAKILIELGADVNAYSPGSNAGTPLHHAVKRGLEQTVKLLLSNGANALKKNDDGYSSLEVARVKGYSNLVRVIESHISFFSGWLRELYGPGFLEALVPQLLSKKIWVVVLPCHSPHPRKPLRLVLAIYNCLQDAQPRASIALWKAKIEEPKFHQPVPVLIIFDKSTRTRYKLLGSSDDVAKQQLQWLCNACRGISQVVPPTLLPNAHSPVVALTAPASNAEDVELAMAINASLISAKEERPPIQNSQLTSEVGNANGWESSGDNSTHNGWLLTGVSTPSKFSGDGRVDEPAVDVYNGWGSPEIGSSSNPTRESVNGMHEIPGAASNTLADSANNTSHNGWDTVGQSVSPSREGSRGRLSKLAEVVHNGWGSSKTGLRSCLSQNNSTSLVPSICEPPEVVSFPSAPPIPEDADDGGPVHYPSVDFSPVDLTMPSVHHEEATINHVIEDGGASSSCVTQVKEDVGACCSSCVICLDAPVEGACIPCGHMGGCMSCLNEIKDKKWGCPVCRSKIDQIIRIYAV
ncbi:E3 ubiquitin-protein ligase xbat35 protein [Thalictrum thalictroides]|uniref:E3 ubiquitin-protein ligase xbat35 protein n=1 Tax=Thalictrum thalictroides TaxID=46969 RepID=A0A7J6WFC2_THATH|nr:E3 ubiquitin-protein ligase xbat35 protein [Thalictrum thalictroides]